MPQHERGGLSISKKKYVCNALTHRTWVKCGVRDAGCGEVATGNLRGKVAGKHPAFYQGLPRTPHSPHPANIGFFLATFPANDACKK